MEVDGSVDNSAGGCFGLPDTPDAELEEVFPDAARPEINNGGGRGGSGLGIKTVRGGRLHGEELGIVCERVNDFTDLDRSGPEPEEETEGCTIGVSFCTMIVPGRVCSSAHRSESSTRGLHAEF